MKTALLLIVMLMVPVSPVWCDDTTTGWIVYDVKDSIPVEAGIKYNIKINFDSMTMIVNGNLYRICKTEESNDTIGEWGETAGDYQFTRKTALEFVVYGTVKI